MFSSDYQRTLILAEIRANITNLDKQVEAIKVIREAFERVKVPGLEIILTGPAAFAVESGEDIRSDVRLLTWLAVIFVTLFLLLVYRSIPMLLMVAAPLITGVIAATAMILTVHGQIHGITLAFGVTLAGVAVDYPIHLLTGLAKHTENQSGYVEKIWPTLRLACHGADFNGNRLCSFSCIRVWRVATAWSVYHYRPDHRGSVCPVGSCPSCSAPG